MSELICPRCEHDHSHNRMAHMHGRIGWDVDCPWCSCAMDERAISGHSQARMAAAPELRAGINPHAPTDAQITEWRDAASWHEDFLGRAGDLLGDWLRDDDQAFDGIVLEAIGRVVRAAAAGMPYLFASDGRSFVCLACNKRAWKAAGFTHDDHDDACPLLDVTHPAAPPATATEGGDRE